VHARTFCPQPETDIRTTAIASAFIKMSRMAPPSQKKRRLDDTMKGKTSTSKKRIRKQHNYHSSEDDPDAPEDFKPVSLGDSEGEDEDMAMAGEIEGKPEEVQSPSEGSEDEQDPDADSTGEEDDEVDQQNGMIGKKPTSKRNDPEAFSTSISKILSTKLPQTARKDPVLSRSREAHEKGTSLANERLEKKAKSKLRAEKKQEMDKARDTDVLGLHSGTTGEVAEEEKRLRKMAQRGVVKLFNAVRVAQVRGEQAAKEEKKKGTVGIANREEKAKEMSKGAFLDLINRQKKSRP
jgi:Rrp15p